MKRPIWVVVIAIVVIISAYMLRPQNVTGLQHGNQLYILGHFDDAMTVYKNATATDPAKAAEATRMMSICYQHVSDPSNACDSELESAKNLPASRFANLAPFGVASASSSVPGYEPNRSNDQDFDTQWNAASDGPNEWYEIDWASPQRFDSVTVLYGDGYSHARTRLAVQIWDAATSSWKTIASKGDGTDPLPAEAEVSFREVTSAKIRLTGVVTLREFGVYGHIQGSFVTGKVTENAAIDRFQVPW